MLGTNTTCKARLTPSYLPTMNSSAPPFPNPPKAQRVQNPVPSHCALSTQGCPGMLKTSQGGSAHCGKGPPLLSTVATPESRGERVPCRWQQQDSLLGWRPESCPRRAGGPGSLQGLSGCVTLNLCSPYHSFPWVLIFTSLPPHSAVNVDDTVGIYCALTVTQALSHRL